MALIVLRGPQVVFAAGTILSCTNAKFPGSQGLRWSFEQLNGWWTGVRRYTNTLRIVTSSPLVGPIAIQQFLISFGAIQGNYYTFPLPEYNSPALPGNISEQDTGSFLQDVDVKQETDDGKQWLVGLSYGPFDLNHDLGSSNLTNGSVNPLESAPEVHWSSAKYEVSYPQDINGIPFLNTVGDPFENPPKKEESRQVLTYVVNSSTYVESWAQQYRDSINSDMFLGFMPHQAKCKDIQGQRIYTADYGYYWRISYEFEFRVQTFTFSDGETQTYGFEDIVLNQGLHKLIPVTGTNGAVVPILVNGVPTSVPVALTEAGAVLNETWITNESGTMVNPEPFFLVFLNYQEQEFANLNIDDNVFTQNQ